MLLLGSCKGLGGWSVGMRSRGGRRLVLLVVRLEGRRLRLGSERWGLRIMKILLGDDMELDVFDRVGMLCGFRWSDEVMK
jgi:hypothetical protein